MVDRPHIASLLRRLHLRIRADIHRAIVEAGFDDLTPAHAYVFQIPGPDGARPSDLARRTNTTKQVMNHLLGALEANGYLQRRADPTDGRSRIVHLTSKGRDVMQVMARASLDIEAAWASTLGSDAVEDLRSRLIEADARYVDSGAAPLPDKAPSSEAGAPTSLRPST
jgi:DNA-binding MarR family transcriptional regulator